MTFNTELANRVLEQIEAHPETWDQTVWTSDCGTALCFAGWAVRLSNPFTVVVPDNPFDELEYYNSEGVKIDLNLEASKVLGLVVTDYYPQSVHWLFCYSNTLEDLKRIVTQLSSSNLNSEDAQPAVE